MAVDHDAMMAARNGMALSGDPTWPDSEGTRWTVYFRRLAAAYPGSQLARACEQTANLWAENEFGTVADDLQTTSDPYVAHAQASAAAHQPPSILHDPDVARLIADRDACAKERDREHSSAIFWATAFGDKAALAISLRERLRTAIAALCRIAKMELVPETGELDANHPINRLPWLRGIAESELAFQSKMAAQERSAAILERNNPRYPTPEQPAKATMERPNAGPEQPPA